MGTHYFINVSIRKFFVGHPEVEKPVTSGTSNIHLGVFSGQTMVLATVKKQSFMQLESSADIYIHNVGFTCEVFDKK